jgi:hypothetical protein
MAAGRIFGIVGEFDATDRLEEAVRALKADGYTHLEAYTPYPVAAVGDLLDGRPTRMSPLVLAGGVAGGIAAYGFQWWNHTIHNAINVGGRPLHSWPNFIPVTFEITILGAAVTAVAATLLLNGLPRLHHPIFNHPRFSLAEPHRFFLSVEAADPRWDPDALRRVLTDHGAVEVSDVPA